MITFNDKQSAIDFVKQKLETEGENYDIEKQGSKYIAYKSKYKGRISGLHFYNDENNLHTIAISPGASTKTKLHELGHAKLGHISYTDDTPEEWTRKELEAEEFAYKNMNKKLPITAISRVQRQLISEGIKKNTVMAETTRWLKEKEYNITDTEKSYLWNNM